MPDIPTFNLPRPIGSINIVGNGSAVMEPVSEGDIEIAMQANHETQKLQYDKAMEALERAAKKLQSVYERMVVEHRQAIAKLSIEIARKILSQKVKDGDYQIESIVQEALNNAPARSKYRSATESSGFSQMPANATERQYACLRKTCRRSGDWPRGVRGRNAKRQSRIVDRRTP